MATALQHWCSVPGHLIFLTFHFSDFGIHIHHNINRDFDPGSSLARTSLTSVSLRPWLSPKPVRFSSLTGEFQSSHWSNCCSRPSLIGQKSHQAYMLSSVELLYSPNPSLVWSHTTYICSHRSGLLYSPTPHWSQVAPRINVIIGRIAVLAPPLIGLKSHHAHTICSHWSNAALLVLSSWLKNVFCHSVLFWECTILFTSVKGSHYQKPE